MFEAGYIMSDTEANTDWMKVVDPDSADMDYEAIDYFWQSDLTDPVKAGAPGGYNEAQPRWPAGSPGGLGGQWKSKTGKANFKHLKQKKNAGKITRKSIKFIDSLEKTQFEILRWENDNEDYKRYFAGSEFVDIFGVHTVVGTNAIKMKDSLARKWMLDSLFTGELMSTDRATVAMFRKITDPNFATSDEGLHNGIIGSYDHFGTMYSGGYIDLGDIDVEPGFGAGKYEQRLWKEKGTGILKERLENQWGFQYQAELVSAEEFFRVIDSDPHFAQAFHESNQSMLHDLDSGKWEINSWRRDRYTKGLKKKTVRSYETFSGWIHAWAEASNDENLKMLETQRIAGKMIDRERHLTPWQKMNHGLAMQSREYWMSSPEFSIYKNDDYGAHTKQTMPFEWGWNPDNNEYRFVQGTTPRGKEHEKLTTDALQHMYQRTQTWFRDQGYKPTDRVLLYRGFGIKTGTDFATNVKPGDLVDTTFNPMESWSLNPTTAIGFGYKPGHIKYVAAMEVPVSRVLSTAHTGFGCGNEYEYVLLNSDVVDTAYIVSRNSKYKPVVFKD